MIVTKGNMNGVAARELSKFCGWVAVGKSQQLESPTRPADKTITGTGYRHSPS